MKVVYLQSDCFKPLDSMMLTFKKFRPTLHCEFLNTRAIMDLGGVKIARLPEKTNGINEFTLKRLSVKVID